MTEKAQNDADTRSSASGDRPEGLPAPARVVGQVAHERAQSTPQTLEEFIIATYGGVGRKVSLKPKALAVLPLPAQLPDSFYASLVPAIESASGLSVALEFLLLLPRLKAELRLRSVLTNFIGRCLGAHPIFVSSPELQAVLANQPEAPSPRSALRLLAEMRTPVARDKKPKARDKSASAERLNAMACLALWIHETRGYSLEAMIQDLQSVLWEQAADRLKDESAQLRALLAKPTVQSLGLVGRAFRRIADEQRTLAENARKAEGYARARTNSLLSELTQTKSALTSNEARIRELESELAALRSQHAVDRSHAVDDQARLRGRIARLLSEASTLLEEGLHALRRETPIVGCDG